MHEILGSTLRFPIRTEARKIKLDLSKNCSNVSEPISKLLEALHITTWDPDDTGSSRAGED